mmetsp:Transcript_28474/g.59653  ORF Transcript_28474/g.59653 Transcript_28474/m.59653 type:complete len:429 (-) Transcript_28474:52-1338(-)
MYSILRYLHGIFGSVTNNNNIEDNSANIIEYIMFSRALPFLALAAVLTNTHAFVAPAGPSAFKTDRDPSLSAFKDLISFGKTAAAVRSMPELLGIDKDGNTVRIPVKNIERDWSFDDYEATGEFSTNLFLPKDRKVKGCAFFMHGFSQYPIAYRQTLIDACDSASVAIIAVDTGLTSEGVLNESMKSKLKRGSDSPQFILQRAVSEDTKQCIRMVMEGNDLFAEYGVKKSTVGNKIAVMGHSMGGGLSFPVAADCDIDYVFTMAPAFGEELFDPINEGVEKRTPKYSMLLAGGWDLIAPAKKVEEISATANSKEQNSSIFVNIARGLHTGFEDSVVIFDVPINSITKITGYATKIFGLADVAFMKLLDLIAFGRTKTGQLDGSSALMSYFLCAMVAGKGITTEDAEKYLDDEIADIFEKKFDFKYGSS